MTEKEETSSTPLSNRGGAQRHTMITRSGGSTVEPPAPATEKPVAKKPKVGADDAN